MPIEADANGMELQAAEALLQLHCAPRRSASDIKLEIMEIEGAATLLLSFQPTPETPLTNALSPSFNAVESARHCSFSTRDDNSETNSQSSFDSPVTYRGRKQNYRELKPAYTRRDVRQAKEVPKMAKASQRSLFNGSTNQPIRLGQKETCEKGTQTDDGDWNEKTTLVAITKIDKIILRLHAKMHKLESQLKESRRRSQSPLVAEHGPDVSTDVLQIQQYNQQKNIDKKRKSAKRSSSSCNTTNTVDSAASDDEGKPEDQHNPTKQIIHDMLKPKDSDMVLIGEGYASVPARLLRQINWSSYTGATRKLLTAVFSRRVLATHSLTGKPSPAFPGKPAKKRLDPELVNDIVQVVVERCRVPVSVVRTSITTKCADESKMFRSRQQNKKKQQ